MKNEVKGSLTLELDEIKLNCNLLFQKNETGESVNYSAIINLLQHHQIKKSPEKKVIENFLTQAGETNSLKIHLLEGFPSEGPLGEQYAWQNVELPEEKEELSREVIEVAPAPDLYITKTIKEDVEKVIRKKGKFPFSAGREEVIKQTVSKESKQKAIVSTEVIEVKWVQEGQQIAKIIRPVSGKNGLNILGKVIPFTQSSESVFYLSEQFKKERDNLIACTTGFLRIGKNWADIVEHSEYEWEVKGSDDNMTCLLNYMPGKNNKAIPQISDFYIAAEGKGFNKEDLVSEKELEEMIRNAARTGIVLVDESLSKSKNASFKIVISEDNFKAELFVKKGLGNGKPLVLKEIGQALIKSGLKGLNQKRIQQDLISFIKSSILELENYVLVEGVKPESGENRICSVKAIPLEVDAAKNLLSRTNDYPEEYTAQYKSLESFTWKNIEFLALVKKGEVIASFSPEKKGKAGRTVFGQVLEGSVGESPEIKIYENIKLAEDELISRITGILDYAHDDEGNYTFRVRQHRDCDIHIEVSENNMAARISLIKEYGSGVPLTIELITQKIIEAKVSFGIVDGILEKIVQKAINDGKLVHIPFAKGSLPIHAHEQGINFFVQFEKKEKVLIRKDGKADYKNRGNVLKVTKGQKIAVIPSKFEELKDGYNVLGIKLAAKSNAARQLQFGKNIELKEEGENTFVVAGVTGELIYEKNKLEISNSRIVKGNVDMKVGNIKYPGTVKISGSVMSGFFVMAGEDLFVGENVESSLLSADGNIEINQGIVGGKKAVLRSKGDISAVFAEQATLLSVGDVNIQNGCMHCNVKSNGKLNLTTEKGVLIGGHIQVRNGLNVMNLGTERGTKSKISFGQDYLVADQIQLEEKEVDKLKARVVQIDTQMRELIEEGNQEKLDQKRKEKLKCMKLLESRNVRLFTLRERFEEHNPSEIIIRGTLFPGVQFESHGRFHEISTEKKAVVIYFNSKVGHIQEKHISV